jgi:hypothetical protein
MSLKAQHQDFLARKQNSLRLGSRVWIEQKRRRSLFAGQSWVTVADPYHAFVKDPFLK